MYRGAYSAERYGVVAPCPGAHLRVGVATTEKLTILVHDT